MTSAKGNANSAESRSTVDLDDFRDLGYVVVRSAFSPEVAMACSELIWKEMEAREGIDRQNASTWPAKCPLDLAFRAEDGAPWCDVYTPRLQGAIDLICGEGRADSSNLKVGWWMNTFPRAEDDNAPAPPQWDIEGSWHIDGHDFRHFVTSRQIGLVAIMLFTDVEPNGGGTAVAEGSHWNIIQTMCIDEHFRTKGCSNTEIARRVLDSKATFDVVEITGKAGDVVLLHPFLLHARSSNLGTPRIMAHPRIPLKNNLNLLKPTSILEDSISQIILDLEDGVSLLSTVSDIDTAAVEAEFELERGHFEVGGSELYSTNSRVTFSCIDSVALIDLDVAVEDKKQEREIQTDIEDKEFLLTMGFSKNFIRKRRY